MQFCDNYLDLQTSSQQDISGFSHPFLVMQFTFWLDSNPKILIKKLFLNFLTDSKALETIISTSLTYLISSRPQNVSSLQRTNIPNHKPPTTTAGKAKGLFFRPFRFFLHPSVYFSHYVEQQCELRINKSNSIPPIHTHPAAVTGVGTSYAATTRKHSTGSSIDISLLMENGDVLQAASDFFTSRFNVDSTHSRARILYNVPTILAQHQKREIDVFGLKCVWRRVDFHVSCHSSIPFIQFRYLFLHLLEAPHGRWGRRACCRCRD